MSQIRRGTARRLGLQRPLTAEQSHQGVLDFVADLNRACDELSAFFACATAEQSRENYRLAGGGEP